jgi:hypothetical protein
MVKSLPCNPIRESRRIQFAPEERTSNMFKNYSLNRLLVLTATAGFAFLLADTVIEHWSILKEDIPSYIPIVFSVVAFLVSLMTFMRWSDNWLRLFRVTLFASMVIAVAGVYFHVAKDDDEDEGKQQVVQPKDDKDKPLLAPFAFGGMAIIGLLGASKSLRAEAKPSET